jgi:hypothetical protein
MTLMMNANNVQGNQLRRDLNYVVCIGNQWRLPTYWAPILRYFAATALFHIWWKTARISESYGELTRDTASQLQRFLGPNKGSGIFLRMRQETVQ